MENLTGAENHYTFSVVSFASFFYYHYTFTATPSFSEAPADVELKEGGTMKLPCRAQGRPKPRVIWDRVGNGLSQQVSEEISQFLEEESQEELLAKAKIMSLRSKRERNESQLLDAKQPTSTPNDSSHDRTKRQIVIHSNNPTVKQIPELYIEDDPSNRGNQEQNSNFVVSEFKQIMRDVNQETFDTNFRRKRSIDDNTDDNTSSDSTPILFFSTATPTESPSLEVNENGELVLRDVKKKDQVRKRDIHRFTLRLCRIPGFIVMINPYLHHILLCRSENGPYFLSKRTVLPKITMTNCRKCLQLPLMLKVTSYA